MGDLRRRGEVSFDYVCPLLDSQPNRVVSPYTIDQQIELLEAGADMLEDSIAHGSSSARMAKFLRESASRMKMARHAK